jgi:hypothetical protein
MIETEKNNKRTEQAQARHELIRQKQRQISSNMRVKMKSGTLMSCTSPKQSKQQKKNIMTASYGYRMQKLQAAYNRIHDEQSSEGNVP